MPVPDDHAGNANVDMRERGWRSKINIVDRISSRVELEDLDNRCHV